jgi:hypothetical protein
MEIRMPKSQTEIKTVTPTPIDLATIQASIPDGVPQRTLTLISAARALTITTEDDYLEADLSLVRVRNARSGIATMLAEKVDSIIKPIRTGLDKLYKARRDIVADLDTPLEQAERIIKSKMADYQVERERARTAELTKLRPAPVVAGVSEAICIPAPAPVVATVPLKAAGSKVVITKKWRVTDLEALVKAAAEGKVTYLVVEANTEVLQGLFESDAAMFTMIPGVEIYDDTKIHGR